MNRDKKKREEEYLFTGTVGVYWKTILDSTIEFGQYL